MSGRDIALWVIAGLAVLCVAGLATAARMWAREAVSGWLAVLYGISVAIGITAVAGWAWWAW